MQIDLERFKGALPYASELFGIYQPLLGWKSTMTVGRLSRNQDEAIRGFSERAIARTPSDVNVRYENDVLVVEGLSVKDVVQTRFVVRVPTELDSIVARVVAAKLPNDRRPTEAEWKALLDRARLDEQLQVSKSLVESVIMLDKIPPGTPLDVINYIQAVRQREIPRDRGGEQLMKILLDREVSVSSYMFWLANNKPSSLDVLFYRRVSDPFSDIGALERDPLSMLGSNGLEAVLSPIGVVHLFRQYFFEFDTFLGPPVGHIWLSPGATLEIVEETVRRSLSERIIQREEETTDRTEQQTTVQDELSTAIKEENRNDLKFGFGASTDYDNGTFEASAHADLSLENSRTTAREQAHKQMRQQSTKIASEIRRSFKSTFRTVTETTSTNSRRYVLQNTTDELINYELRRKMRQVGVQVQDIGTQMCWQVFVDDPGRELGLAKLLHIAQPPDLASLKAPEPPAKLEPKVVDIQLQFPYMRDPSSEGDGELDVLYIEGDDQEHIGGVHNIGYNDKIFYTKQYQLSPPAPGYVLQDQFSLRHQHAGTVDAEVQIADKPNSIVRLIMHQVNFKDQQSIELQLTTTWLPDQATAKALDDAYNEKLKTYDAEKSVAERAAFLAAARERVKLASQIRTRPFEDLREEERIMVYRALIAQLMAVNGAQINNEHLTAELIRAIFDVDKMLYFVAPEWWRPRAHAIANGLHTSPSTSFAVTAQDLVTWEGPLAGNRQSNYLITEESDPARMGSSLGWLLELDGDDLRNAFLNSPWVKAVIPIRPGKEEAAINWLSLAHVAGIDGLDAAYDAPDDELENIKDWLSNTGRTVHDTVTLLDALLYLGDQIKQSYHAATTAMPDPFDPNKNVIPTEVVYEHGFDPLPGGFEVNTDPTKVFSQWVEVLATDQVAAVPYDAEEHL